LSLLSSSPIVSFRQPATLHLSAFLCPLFWIVPTRHVGYDEENILL
jgi:hypothetical protein